MNETTTQADPADTAQSHHKKLRKKKSSQAFFATSVENSQNPMNSRPSWCFSLPNSAFRQKKNMSKLRLFSTFPPSGSDSSEWIQTPAAPKKPTKDHHGQKWEVCPSPAISTPPKRLENVHIQWVFLGPWDGQL